MTKINDFKLSFPIQLKSYWGLLINGENGHIFFHIFHVDEKTQIALT